MTDRPDLLGRCGTCARFVRVTETIDQNGEVRRKGECLLGVWPSPLYETSTCSQYVQRGTFTSHVKAVKKERTRGFGGRARVGTGSGDASPIEREIEIPAEILDMDKDEFREVLRDVIRDELGVTEVELGGRWEGGEVILKPGKEGTAEKRIPIEALFRKVVSIRDKLRVLEQKVNAHPKLTDEEKVQMQQYVTQCYGTLTTFNVLFANKSDNFVGQKGDGD